MINYCTILVIAGFTLLLLALVLFYFSRGDLYLWKFVGTFFLILSLLCFFGYFGLKYKQKITEEDKKGEHSISKPHTRLKGSAEFSFSAILNIF
ncbi:MAG: hypothetical protein Greene041679_210 [Parcubacteria group bacterium Greene0416_79]|nr:MAG: hypothetical protein Greene041679_210 [Parcubacteria group bacterium Greene0416_79]